jgi:hypothetical protein
MSDSVTNNPSVLPIDSRPYGLTYAEWTAKWFKWLLEIPSNNNPANDDTGKNCAVNQSDPNVWFLAGTPGGHAERTCTIPAGKAILFPIVAEWCSEAEFNKVGKDLVKLCRCIIEEWVTEKEVTFDDRHILRGRQLDQYLVPSKHFKCTLKENNIFDLKKGSTDSVSNGYWLMIRKEALSGDRDHTLHFSAKQPGRFDTDVTYKLTIR